MTNPNGGKFFPTAVDIKSVHSNLSQEVIITTVDKLKIVLLEHLQNIESKKEWIAPASLLVTLAIVLTTTTTNDFIFGAYVWTAVFIICSGLVLIWLVISLRKLYKSKSVTELISVIKSESTSMPQPSEENFRANQ